MEKSNYWIEVGTKKVPTTKKGYTLRGVINIQQQKQIDTAFEKVCEVYGVTKEELKSQSRLRKYSEPRKILYYILHRVYQISSEAVALVFNRVSHATVLIGIRKVEGFLQVDKYYREKVSQLGIIKIPS